MNPAPVATESPASARTTRSEYRQYEIERIARQAFDAARKRRGKVSSVDKADVLETSRMWREIVHRIHDEEYPDGGQLEDVLGHNAAMQLINRPATFDVAATENMFGDILSDEAAQITGSLWYARLREPGRRRGALRSRATAPRRISPARASRTPWRRSFRWR